MNAILGWSEILRRGKAEPRIVAKALDVIERNARIQTQLISDLLDVSRIISGKIRLDTKNCDPATALEAALDSMAPAAAAKKIRIEKMIEPLPSLVSGDPSRLQQVFWNLLSNAVKFTPEGGRVQVELRCKESRVETVFRDTGKGIAPDFLPHIFDRFRQGDSSASKQHAGLGLGLAIVKHLVELHGGTVKAESPGAGRGSTFTISLPALTAARPEDPGSGRISAVSDICLNGIRVLVVDDEADTRDILQRLLEERGAEVFLAASAGRAIDLVQEFRPHVLVGDIGMPGQDGYQMIRRIRELPAEQGGQVPAVALTAYSRIEDRTRAMLAGFQYHLSKPVEAAELITTLGMITRRLPKAQPSLTTGPDSTERFGAAE